MFKRALYHLIKQTYELRWVIFFLPSFHDLWVHMESNAQLRSKLSTCSERRLEHLEHLGWRSVRSVRLVLEVNSQVMLSELSHALPAPRESSLFTLKKCYKKQYVKSTTLGTGGGLNASIICILFPCLSAHCPTLLRSLPSNLDGVEA